MCRHASLLGTLLSAAVARVADARKSEPKLFYGVGLLSLFVLGRAGYWVPSLYLAQITASSLLLLPLALQHNWVTADILDSLARTLRQTAENLWAWLRAVMGGVWQRVVEFAAQSQQARRQRRRTR